MALLRAGIERNDRLSHDDRTADMVRIPGGTFRLDGPSDVPAHAGAGLVAQWLESFKEFPPRAKAASFTVSDAMEKISTASANKNRHVSQGGSAHEPASKGE
jgi:hypothetical protein